jgi:TRAP-type C4-dicarboxylate transport system substrate-binding protein
MFKRRTLVSLLAGASLLVATSAFAQFADRTIKFTNGVNEDHPVGVGVKKCRKCWRPRPAAR